MRLSGTLVVVLIPYFSLERPLRHATSLEVCGEVVGCVFITAHEVVAVTVDLNVTTDGHVAGGDKLVVVVNVLVLATAQEGALDDARVLDCRLVDGDGVVCQVERDDEAAVHIFGHASVEAGGVAQDLFVVVNCLEEVGLRLLGHEAVDVAESISLISEAIVGRNLFLNGRSSLGHGDVAEFEELAVLGSVESASPFVASSQVESAVKRDNWLIGADFVASKVVVTNEGKAGLFHFI